MKLPGTHKASAFRRSRCTHAVLLALGSISLNTYAQTIQRVEITGSSIKRIEGEAALPVEIIKREDIDKSGVTTAAELLQKISSNVGGLTDGASVSDVMGGQRGFNGANLRGLGVSSTLVLLNGRRMANFASPGDESGVDLNNIPAGAIQRVEVLKDGASAIYGTDAMGGVINFITRKDYQGGEASVYGLRTSEGGGGKKSASLSGGFGSLSTDRFNVFGALDVQETGRLASSQRKFMQEYSLPDRLSPQLSSYSFPANVDLTSAQLATLNNSGYLKGTGPGGTYVPSPGRRVNFGRETCVNGSPNVVRPLGPGGTEGCSFNYMGDSEVYPDSKKQSFIGRATTLVGESHQVFAEVMLSKAKTNYAASPATSGSINGTSTGIFLPADLQAKTGIITPVNFRFRLTDAGRRTSEVTSQASRFVVGATGKVGAWEYDTAYNHSVNKATDLDIDGWVSRSKMLAGIASGLYNPFVPATDDKGRQFMNSIKINGAARISKGTSDSVDAKLTRSLMALGGGDMMLAVGAEMRREKTSFRSTDALRTNDVQGDRASSDELLADTSNSRDIAGIYTEINAPFSKEWEGQFAIRHDRYKGVHDPRTNFTTPDLSTTNPKVAVSYRPNKQVLARASYGTGFRAPSIAELFLPVRSGTTASFVKDPVSGEIAQFDLDRYGNPLLKPEKSKQFSAGLVLEPNKNWNASLDYWDIRKTDIISEIGEQTVFDNPVYYNDPTIVVRDEGAVSFLQFKKENRGKLNTSGLDIGINWRGDTTSLGRFSASLNGTLITKYKFQSDPHSPMADGLGVFRDDKAVQRWRHKANLDWTNGPVNLSLGNTFFSSYRDQNIPGLADPGYNDRDVKAYSLWDLTGSYAFSKNLKLRAGVINVLDTPPPFTNQSRYFEVTWDPTYGDPRGRSMFANLQYKF